MAFSPLLVQVARVLRRPPPQSEEGTPIPQPPAEIGSWAARLDWGGGGESLSPVSDQRRLSRSGTLFLDPEADIQATDQVTVDGITATFDVTNVTPIRGYSDLHHLEVSLSHVAGS